MKTKPKTIRTKPATCSSRNWLRVKESPTAAAPAPSRTNTRDEAGDERKAGEDDPAGCSWLAQPIRLDRGHGREVAGDERQHAGGEERDEAGAEGDGDRGSAHLEPLELVVEAPLERRVERLAVARPAPASPRTRLQRHASAPTATMPRPSPASGSTQATRSKPLRGGTARTAVPNWSTSCALISLFVSPAAMRARMNAFIRRATGASEVSSVVSQTGQTSSDSSSAAVGFDSLAAAPPRRRARAAAHERREQPHGLACRACRIPSSRSLASSTGPAIR